MADEQRTLTANFTADASGFESGTNALIQKLKALSQDFEQNKAKVNELNTTMRSYQKELQQLSNQTEGGTKATDAQRERMQELRDKIAACATEIGTYKAAQKQLSSEISSANSELNEQRDAVNGVSDSFDTFGDVLKANLLSGAIQQSLSELLSLLKQTVTYCYDVGMAFEAGMSQVEAISGATGTQLDALTEKAKELGSTTKFTATEAAEAMNYMAMAGWDAEQMLSGIDGVMSLAAASGEDLGEVADIVTDALTAFGMEAEDVGHFSDVLAAASANANTNVSMLGESFKYVAPLAGTMGYSIEETAEALGIMANSGIKASTAGTSMRTMLTNLTSGVTITSEAFGELEISAANQDGTMKSLNTVLGELREAFAQMTDEEKTANAAAIAGDRALSGFLALMNAGEDDINSLRSAIENCDGAAQSMAETMQDNLAGSVTIMQSALEGLGNAIYENLAESSNEAVQTFTDAISALSDEIESGRYDELFEHLGEAITTLANEGAELATDVLPDLVDGFASGVSFIVDFKDEILAGVKALIAFKAAIKIGNTISAAATAIKSFKTATDAANASQAAFNVTAAANPYVLIASLAAAAITAVVSFAGSMETATKKAQELKEAADKLNETAKESRQAAKDVAELAEEYKSLSEDAEATAETKERLAEIQEILIDTYGIEAEGIDLVNGKYEEQYDILQDVITQKNALADTQSKAAYYTARDAQNEARSVELETGDLFSSQYMSLLKLYSEAAGGEGVVTPMGMGERASIRFAEGTTYEEEYKILSEIIQGLDEEYGDKVQTELYSGLVEAQKEAYDNWKSYDAIYADYTDATATAATAATNNWDSWETVGPSLLSLQPQLIPTGAAENSASASAEILEVLAAAEEEEKLTAEEREEIYDEKLEALKYYLDMGQITEAEYYKQLAVLRDSYLEEDTKKWRAANVSIYSYQQSLTKSLASSTADDADSIKGSLNEIEAAYKSTLDAIDAEIEKHNQDKEDEELQGQIDEIEKRLQYERLSDFDRYELEKQRQELLDEQEETEWLRQKEAEKELAEEVYTQAQEAYEESSAQLSEALSAAMEIFRALGGTAQSVSNTNTTNNTTQNNSFLMQMVGSTADEIVEAVKKALSSDI